MIRSAYDFLRLHPEGYPAVSTDEFGQPARVSGHQGRWRIEIVKGLFLDNGNRRAGVTV